MEPSFQDWACFLSLLRLGGVVTGAFVGIASSLMSVNIHSASKNGLEAPVLTLLSSMGFRSAISGPLKRSSRSRQVGPPGGPKAFRSNNATLICFPRVSRSVTLRRLGPRREQAQVHCLDESRRWSPRVSRSMTSRWVEPRREERRNAKEHCLDESRRCPLEFPAA